MRERVVDYDMLGKPITAKMAGWHEEWCHLSNEEAERDKAEQEAEADKLAAFLLHLG